MITGARYESPSQCWSRLEGLKQGFMRRCERYAALTIPKLCTPVGQTELNTETTTDYQSLGAAAVNHLNNRILLALFRPGDPFFRLDPNKKAKALIAKLQVSEDQLGAELAKKEMEAVSVLDQKAIRPKLYQVGRHVIVTGNAVLELVKDTARVYGLRTFCVKRTSDGRLHTLIIRECLKFDELDLKVRQLVQGKQPDTEVHFYRLICLQDDGSYQMKAAVDEFELPEQFGGKWPADKMPFHVVTWDLADEADYATGLVEEHLGDFEALSALSESLLDGSILTTEMRWLVNPGGVTTIDDFRKSRNGDALAGTEADVKAVNGGDPKAIEFAIKVIEVYTQRLARAFLMQSAMIRDAERVTAEEIRAIAMELETAFGGVYSQLGANWQKPVATWCLASVDMEVRGTDLAVTVITGLDALTRNGQLEKLRAALGDLALFEQLPPALQARFDFNAIARFVGAGRGIDLGPFLKTDDQVKAEQQQTMQDQTNQQAAIAAGQAHAQANAAPTTEPQTPDQGVQTQ
jgi:hypothetical protein